MDIRPLHDRIVIKRQKDEEVRKGGIIIPDTAKEKPQEGLVVGVGVGRRTKEGITIPPQVKSGDRVLFGKYAGTDYKSAGEELVIMREEDILAILD
ncbi:MAG: co-chaperone GroES [Acidobacteria bacterium]|nr:co-chaperone GroES [Acidobacteriota bacterium]MBI3657668.1 co-chaperone GroES [Acidobacteriota bacterium]